MAPADDADSEAPADAKPADASLPPAAAAFFRGESASEHSADADETIEVLECNWPAVQVYLACQWTVLAGFGGSHDQGIATQEVMAAMLAHRIRRADMRDTLERVRVMVGAARPIRNKTAA